MCNGTLGCAQDGLVVVDGQDEDFRLVPGADLLVGGVVMAVVVVLVVVMLVSWCIPGVPLEAAPAVAVPASEGMAGESGEHNTPSQYSASLQDWESVIFECSCGGFAQPFNLLADAFFFSLLELLLIDIVESSFSSFGATVSFDPAKSFFILPVEVLPGLSGLSRLSTEEAFVEALEL